MTMNVYLALSMTMSAAVEGIEKKIHPGDPTDQDLYNMSDSEFKKLGIKRLPRNLLTAIEALKNDKLTDEVLGPIMKKSLLAYKNDELGTLPSSCYRLGSKRVSKTLLMIKHIKSLS